jgi:dTMP kinase
VTAPDLENDAALAVGLAAKGGYRRLFRNRGFGALWVGQTISGIGDWLIVGLLIPMVIRLSNGSSMAVAGIMIAKIIPSLLIGSVLGVLVDRFDRRRLMIACDLINSVLCLGLLATNALSDSPGLALAVIYTVTFLMEICNLLLVPAKNALIPMIVEEKDLAAANGLSYTTQQASMLIGLVGSAAIVSVFAAFLKGIIAAGIPVVSTFVAGAPDLAGPQGGIVVDFFSFLVSAALITSIRVPSMERRDRALDLRLFGRDVVESFNVLRERRELRGFLTAVGLAILGGGAIVPVGLVYVQQNLVGGVPFLDLVPPLQRLASQSSGTFMLVFMGLGMFLGAVMVPRIATRVTLERLFVAGVAGFGLAMLGFSTTGWYWVASIFAVAAGFLIAQVTVAGNTYIAETVADALRGRVFAALESVLRVALLASMVFTAPVGDIVGGFVRRFVESTHGDPAELVLTGSRITLIFASCIVLLAAVYAMRAIPWRRPKNGEVLANG